MNRLDLPNYVNVNDVTEDKVFALLFVEKGLTKYEITKKINVSYERVCDIIRKMEEKGFLVCRKFDNGHFYYLTAEGCRVAQYRLNPGTYLDIYEYLFELKYYTHNIINFMSYVFYKYYIEGVWDGNTLESQYLDWCEVNNLNPKGYVKKYEK